MEKSEIMKLKAQFDNYKAEYSNIETKEERKKELIPFMQANLQKRSGKDEGCIMCIDGKEYSLTSDNVEDLYAIHGTLIAESSQNKVTEVADESREVANERNKYGPDNIYPKK